MREIRFRVYCKNRKEFVRIVDLGLFGTGKVKSVAFTYKDDPYERMDCDLPGDVELVQYTGLKDKNGVEIYEGDIIWDAHAEIHGKVTFDEGAFCVEWGTHIEHLFEVIIDGYAEVVDNIFENPELLGDSR